MAENGKTKIILTIIIGLFGVMCFGFALTVTQKYKAARDNANTLTQKMDASKKELLKIPELEGKMFEAVDRAKGAVSELESVQEELEEVNTQLEEVQGELDALKEGGVAEESGSDGEESGDSSELASALDSAKEKIESLTSEKEELLSKLQEAESAVANADANVSSTAEPKIVTVVKTVSVSTGGGTFNGQYSIDPGAGSKVRTIALHRGLGSEFVKTVPASNAKTQCGACGESKCDGKSPCPAECAGKHCLIKRINARLTELNSYANAHESIRTRIGENSINTVTSVKAKASQEKISSALTELLESYVKLCNIVSNCDKLTTWERGNASCSLNKRVSVYVSKLALMNESGKFSIDQDVKLLLSKLGGEQKYFSKS